MKIIRSHILSQHPRILFGMSLRHGGVSGKDLGLNMSYNVGDNPENVAANRSLFFRELNIDESRTAFPLQEHTATVVHSTLPGKYSHCDALITGRKDIFLAITIADCTPVLLYDTKNDVVAGIHAGWRGTAAGITVNAVRLMSDRYATHPGDIVAFIGPSAGACCYEVGGEVAATFPPSCVSPRQNGKFLLDVKKTNMLQLLENGVQESHIEVHSDCSIHNTDYHSHRRDGIRSGRMLAVIGMRK